MKMRKLLTSAILLVSAAFWCAAGSPFSAGVEWGANVMFYSTVKNNYFDVSGARVDVSSCGFSYHANGSVRVFMGICAGEKLRFDLGSGYAGISDSRRVVPLTIRANYLSAGRCSDGIVAFLDGGASFSTINEGVKGLLASCGAGYRIHLIGGAGLSFLLNLRFATDSPGIISPDGSGFVPKKDIRGNLAGYYSAGITISIDL